MTLIGLGYKARQGKDSVANFIKTQDPRAKIYAFADELKRYCKEHHTFLKLQWEHYHLGELHPPKQDPIYGYTDILQWYGTDIIRKENPNHWVNRLEARLFREQPELAIVTDVRYPNEAEYIKKAGGFMVEVLRLDERGNQYQDPGRDPNHISETALDNYDGWDFVITAKDGDLAMLRKISIGVWNLVANNYIYDPTEDAAITLTEQDIIEAHQLDLNFTGSADSTPDATGFPE